MAVVEEIDVATLARWLAEDSVLLVDVREANEFAAERIPHAVLHPLSGFDPTRLRAPAGKRLVLQCRSGKRSLQAGQVLLAQGHAEAAHLTGGILAWKEAGRPVEAG